MTTKNNNDTIKTEKGKKPFSIYQKGGDKMKIEKYIIINNLQNINEDIITDNSFNLIGSDCVLYLINNGYKIQKNLYKQQLYFIYEEKEK